MRVAVADDSALFRHGLVELLTGAGVEVCAQAPDAATLDRRLGPELPDVVILDLRMPPTFTDEGLAAADAWKSRSPETGVLVLSTYSENAYAHRLLSRDLPGVGYLLKDRVEDTPALVEALGRLASGGCVVDPHLVAGLLSYQRRRSRLDVLSDRELEVLGLMAEGASNAGIGTRLTISPRTVENHVSAVFTKLDLPEAPDENRRVRAVLTYLRGRAPSDTSGRN